MASHIALELVGNPLPKGMFACHRCDNPACVNPDHLFFGTQRDNVHDAIAKGRHDLSGLRPGQYKHSQKIRNEAKLLYEAGHRMSHIAKRFGIPVGTVQCWFMGWGHIPIRQSLRTHCPRGHLYNGRHKNGNRYCRTCKNEARRLKHAS